MYPLNLIVLKFCSEVKTDTNLLCEKKDLDNIKQYYRRIKFRDISVSMCVLMGCRDKTTPITGSSGLIAMMHRLNCCSVIIVEIVNMFSWGHCWSNRFINGVLFSTGVTWLEFDVWYHVVMFCEPSKCNDYHNDDLILFRDVIGTSNSI